jgi:hypothetical protein
MGLIGMLVVGRWHVNQWELVGFGALGVARRGPGQNTVPLPTNVFWGVSNAMLI